MNELLNKADDLFSTLARETVASVDKNISAAVFAGTRVKRRVVSNESDKHKALKSNKYAGTTKSLVTNHDPAMGHPAPISSKPT